MALCNCIHALAADRTPQVLYSHQLLMQEGPWRRREATCLAVLVEWEVDQVQSTIFLSYLDGEIRISILTAVKF